MHLIGTVYMLGLGAACAIMFYNYIKNIYILFGCCIRCKSGPICSIVWRHDSPLNAPASKGGNASAARLPIREDAEWGKAILLFNQGVFLVHSWSVVVQLSFFFLGGGGGGICIRCINGRFEQDLNLRAPRTWEVGIQATIKMVCAEAQWWCAWKIPRLGEVLSHTLATILEQENATFV